MRLEVERQAHDCFWIVIMQFFWLVTDFKNIHVQIDAQL